MVDVDAGGGLARPNILGPMGAGALIDARSAPPSGDSVEFMHAVSTPGNDPSVTPDPVATPTGSVGAVGAGSTSLPVFTFVLDSITFALDSAGHGGTALLPIAASAAVDAHAPGMLDAPLEGAMLQAGAPATHALTRAMDASASDLFAAEIATDAGTNPATEDGTAAASATTLRVEIPYEVEVGTPAEVLVIALNPANRPAGEYSGTVTFHSSDPGAALPAPVTFGPADNGIHVATVIFSSAGSQTLAVSDGANALRDIVTVWVRRSVGRRRNQRNRDVLDIWLAS